MRRKELPEWFDLGNYSYLQRKETPAKAILRQLYKRREIFQYVESSDFSSSSLANNHNWNSIKNNKRFLIDRVRLFTYPTSDVSLIEKIADDFNFSPSEHEVDLRINLQAPSSVIAEELNTILRHVRAKRGITQRAPIASREKLRKIISYQIIPLSDLLLFEKEENCKFTSKFLAQVFGLGDSHSDSEHIRTVRKPFVKKVMEEGFLEELEVNLKIKPIRY